MESCLKLRDWMLIGLAVLAYAVDLPARAASPVAASGGLLPSGLHSDRAAWQHFAGIVAPAGRGRVEFETWAGDEHIYTETPAWPSDEAASVKRLRRGVLQRLTMPHALGDDSGASADCGAVASPAAGNFPVQGLQPGQQPCFAEEVRRNLASYRYIVQNQLNTRAGLAAAYQKAQGGWRVSLPEDAVQVKADWVPVETLIAWLGRNGVRLGAAQVRAQFYTTIAQGTSYALVAMHISSKELPTWVWASFEHRLNPGRCDTMGCSDSFGATARKVAPQGVSNAQYPACAKTPALKKLFAARRVADTWNNYCLKASEIAFVSPGGAPLMHGNSFTERVAAGIPIQRSSCIACHASAGFTSDGSVYAKQLVSRPMGTVKLPADIVANDFVWGILTINAMPVEQAKIPHNLDRTRITARR